MDAMAVVEHLANGYAAEASPRYARANNSAGEYIHHHRGPITAQKVGFAADQVDAP
jgi:hypothetical protein